MRQLWLRFQVLPGERAKSKNSVEQGGELTRCFGNFLRAMGASSLAAGRQPRGVATDTCAENSTIRDPMTGRRGPAEPHRARHWRAQIHRARVAVEAPTDHRAPRLAVVEVGTARWCARPRQRWRSKITVFGTTIEMAIGERGAD
jgi:hypothetical protein